MGEVELLLLEVDDCLLGVVESGQDVVHLSHLLLGPVGLELPKLLYLKISLEVIMIQEFNLHLSIKNTFDSQCGVPFIRIVKLTNLLLFFVKSRKCFYQNLIKIDNAF